MVPARKVMKASTLSDNTDSFQIWLLNKLRFHRVLYGQPSILIILVTHSLILGFFMVSLPLYASLAMPTRSRGLEWPST